MTAWTRRCQSAGKAAQKIVPLRPRTPCWKGLSADSEEKREPVSDIETAKVDSLKVLDPKRPIREAVIPRHLTDLFERGGFHCFDLIQDFEIFRHRLVLRRLLLQDGMEHRFLDVGFGGAAGLVNEGIGAARLEPGALFQHPVLGGVIP